MIGVLGPVESTGVPVVGRMRDGGIRKRPVGQVGGRLRFWRATLIVVFGGLNLLLSAGAEADSAEAPDLSRDTSPLRREANSDLHDLDGRHNIPDSDGSTASQSLHSLREQITFIMFVDCLCTCVNHSTDTPAASTNGLV